jgi:hypothetical protein
MKKNSIFLIAAFTLAIFSFNSCSDVKPKDVSLKNMNDSINYTLGQWQGDVFKQQYFADDADGKQLAAFIESLDKAYGSKNADEMYDLGIQVGKYFNDQIQNGYFGDSTLVGDIDMLLVGLVNALNDYQDVISSTEADSIVQAVQMKVHSKMYGAPNN